MKKTRASPRSWEEADGTETAWRHRTPFSVTVRYVFASRVLSAARTIERANGEAVGKHVEGLREFYLSRLSVKELARCTSSEGEGKRGPIGTNIVFQ